MYTARQDGTIEVINRCQSTKDDRMREAKGRAWVVDPGTNTRLKVSFFWPFKGDYWIIELGQDYDYAVVGTPNRKYLWLLSRSPQMAPEVLAKIIENVERQGFDGTKLVFD